MYKRIFSMAAVAAAISAPVFAGCSSSSTVAPGGTDAGTDTGSGSGSGGTQDSGAGEAAAQPVPPTGTPILTLEAANVVTATEDNQIIYLDSPTSISAVPVAGGASTAIAPVQINPNTNGPLLFVQKTAVLNWVNATLTATPAAGKLYIWTAAGGSHTLDTASQVGGARTDGKIVAWVGNIANGTADVMVANVDGSGKKTLQSGVRADSKCTPAVEVSGAYVVVASCAAVPVVDGGAPEAGAVDAGSDAGEAGAGPSANAWTVETYTGATFGTVATIGANIGSLGVDEAGDKLFTTDFTNGELLVHAMSGGNAVSIDKAVTTAFLTKDGANILYTTSAKELKRAPTGAGSATTLTTGFPGISQLSPDEKSVLGYTTNNASAGTSDFLLASATTAGAVTTLTTDKTGAIYGDAFTADSSHVIFYAPTSGGQGAMQVAATSGGAPTQVSPTGWLDYATTGSKVVYADNYDGSKYVDLKWLDTATNKSTTLVTTIDNQPLVTTDKKYVVFSWHAPTGSTQKSGIYVIPAP